MNQLSAFILIFLAGFFPYMPILHAGESPKKEIHCDTIDHEHENENGDHSMESCIEIIKKIQRGTPVNTDTAPIIFVFAPFERYYALHVETPRKIIQSNLHATDPPLRHPPNLVGTIRIIS